MSAGMGWTAEGELADARKSIGILRARAELAERRAAAAEERAEWAGDGREYVATERDRWQKIAEGYREGAKEVLALNKRLQEAADPLAGIVAEVLRLTQAPTDGLILAACIRDGVPVYAAALALYRALADPGSADASHSAAESQP